MSKTPVRPHFGSAYALTRFFVRMALFCVLATLGAQGFGKTLSAWLILASLYCVVAAALRRCGASRPGAGNWPISVKRPPMPRSALSRRGLLKRARDRGFRAAPEFQLPILWN